MRVLISNAHYHETLIDATVIDGPYLAVAANKRIDRRAKTASIYLELSEGGEVLPSWSVRVLTDFANRLFSLYPEARREGANEWLVAADQLQTRMLLGRLAAKELLVDMDTFERVLRARLGTQYAIVRLRDPAYLNQLLENMRENKLATKVDAAFSELDGLPVVEARKHIDDEWRRVSRVRHRDAEANLETFIAAIPEIIHPYAVDDVLGSLAHLHRQVPVSGVNLAPVWVHWQRLERLAEERGVKHRLGARPPEPRSGTDALFSLGRPLAEVLLADGNLAPSHLPLRVTALQARKALATWREKKPSESHVLDAAHAYALLDCDVYLTLDGLFADILEEVKGDADREHVSICSSWSEAREALSRLL